MQIITLHWDEINPLDINSYIRQGGYEALQKVVRESTPEKVISEIKASRLRGRGGAGFPTGEKWETASKTPSEEKYFICNLDESEPGTYKDRMIAEKNPHQILEGLLIGAFAVGAKKTFIYINGNYRKQAEILRIAIEQARAKGFFGGESSADISVFEGAGAYICGEETALLNSIEGKRGEPRSKPPFPPVSGLFGKPTIVNNAETMANVPYIIREGAENFSQIGASTCPGTKLFLLEGAVKSKGMVEAPLGTTAEELIFNSLYGGGMEPGKEFWFAQIGGASGRLMPEEKLSQKLAYGEGEYPLGSGSILIVDKNAEIKELLLSWAGFFHRESCGKCVPCREGTYRLWEIAKRLKKMVRRDRDRENIEDILWTLSNTTFCPLGKFASVAWSDAVRMFGDEIFG